MFPVRILITGGSGFLGQYLNIELSESHEILTLYYKRTGNCGDYNSTSVNLNDLKKLEEFFSSFEPECVIHTAAVTSQEEINAAGSKYVYATNVTSRKKRKLSKNRFTPDPAVRC